MANIAIVGLGTLGGMFASIYVDEGHRVQVLCDGERLQRYRTKGFLVNGKPLAVEYVSPEEANKPDYILVATKYGGLQAAAELIRPVLKDDTIILSVLNGIDSEEVLARELNLPPLMICHSAYTDSFRIPEGNGITFSNPGIFMYGERDGSESERFHRVREIISSKQFPDYVKPSKTIRRDSWWKFMLNVGTNQISAVLNANFYHMYSNPYIRQIITETMMEVITLANLEGIELSKADIDAALIAGENSPVPEGSPSMNQDMVAGRKTEVEMFSKLVCEMGRERGVPTPMNHMLYLLVRAKEVMQGN